MRLTFELQVSYGKQRWYPRNESALALVTLTGRKCLKSDELIMLRTAGFDLNLIGGSL